MIDEGGLFLRRAFGAWGFHALFVLGRVQVRVRAQLRVVVRVT